MKTLNSNLDPVVYQYGFEHPDKNFGSTINPCTPHIMELRQATKREKYDSKTHMKILYYKLAILILYFIAFTVIALVF